jgi:hypothetical protein
MRRVLCIGLAVLFAFSLTGCFAPVSAAPLTTASSFVTAAEGLLQQARDIIDWQIEDSTREMKEREEAIKNGETYEEDMSIDEEWDKSVQLAECTAKMNALADAFAQVEKTNNKEVDLTIDAAAHYLDMAKNALADLMKIVVFNFSEYEACRPIMEFPDAGDDVDFLVYTEELWKSVDQSMQNMKAVDCPPFMQQNYDAWIEQFGAFSVRSR